MKSTPIDIKMQDVLVSTLKTNKIYGASFAIRSKDFQWAGACGNMQVDTPFFIASTTKLFTTALVMHYRHVGKLMLEDALTKYFDSDFLSGLHRYRHHDYGSKICIRHLLSHTSGLPDYFQDAPKKGMSLEKQLLAGTDRSWTFEECMELTKKLGGIFPPDRQGKAHYSDANFQLLGRIIELVSGQTFADNCEKIILRPLGLNGTYVFTNSRDQHPHPLYYKTKVLNIPKAMSSFGPDGGMVSTADDLIQFTEAFFTGKLFPLSYMSEMQVWNKIFFPFQSGLGIHLFKLPWFFDLFGTVPSFIGHSGLSGALAYFSPKENIYIAGTVNQIANPDLSFRAMIKFVQTLTRNR